MRIDMGYVLGHLSEFAVFLYFVGIPVFGLRSYTRERFCAVALSAVGYGILFAVGLFAKIPITTVAFIAVNSLLLYYVGNLGLKEALFYGLIFDLLSDIGEYTLAFMVNADITALSTLSTIQSMAITLGGKVFYFCGMIIVKHFSEKISVISPITLIIPSSTVIYLYVMMRAESSFLLFILSCLTFLLVNIAAFVANAVISEKNQRLLNLQKEYLRKNTELAEYKVFAEKYENTRIMRHDFRRHMNILRELIGNDDVHAQEYLSQICDANDEIQFTEYTNNKILNILLSQKIKVCHEHNVNISIKSENPDMAFLSEFDTVAIFSNLVDNAIEAAAKSPRRVVYIDLYTVNNHFSVFRIENSVNKIPDMKKEPGIGIKSVCAALQKYRSIPVFEYNRNTGLMRTVVTLYADTETP